MKTIPRRYRLLWPGMLILVLALLATPQPVGARRLETAGAPARTAPNIVLILTDDQRWDTLWAMPTVQAELVQKGITFSNAFSVNSLCCPSRASILTGQYSHTTRVYSNAGRFGGFNAFHSDSNTVSTWLQGAGYRTALIGKYMNGYNVNYLPPGWDRWVAFVNSPGDNGGYYRYTLNEDGQYVWYDSAAADYSTDVLASHADTFIRGTPQSQPLFLYLAPKAPHLPATPAPRHQSTFGDLLPHRPPNYNEEIVTDKPAWLQAIPPLTLSKQQQIDQRRKRQYQSLLAVDDAVGTVLSALTDTGRLSNTLIVFASDNGWSWGEHRWNDKMVPYEESIRIPMVIRHDSVITTPGTDTHLVANIDLGPTFAATAGVEAVGAEGADLTRLFTDGKALWRHNLLVEHLTRQDGLTTFCAVRNESLQPEGFTYVHYDTGEEELYDLKTDVFQLDNAVADPAYASQLEALRTVEARICDPRPPGWGP